MRFFAIFILLSSLLRSQRYCLNQRWQSIRNAGSMCQYRLPIIIWAIAAMALPFAEGANAKEVAPLGANLEHFHYPWSVQQFPVQVGATSGQMSYMDVQPEQSNGQTAILLHGKNFCGATWESTARALLSEGFRVLIPDQIGFCKSSKPRNAQYTFAMLANFTESLMVERGIGDAIIVGHSTGGMLAMHFALIFPERVSQLVLVNPLGLTDRLAEGVNYFSLDKLIKQEASKNYNSIREYQLKTYYHGNWKPRYDRWIQMLAGQYESPGGENVIIAQAKTSEMILTQPVSPHFERLKMPVTLMIGMRDTTTFGKGQAPQGIRDKLEAIPALAEKAAERIAQARLIRFPRYGHSPQVEAPEEFEQALLLALQREGS